MHYLATRSWPIENPDLDLQDLLDEATRDLRVYLARHNVVSVDSPRWSVTTDRIQVRVPVRDLTTRETARAGWHGRFRREAVTRAATRPVDNVASEAAKEAQSLALQAREISAENRERIAECHRLHPDWSHDRIAFYLHLSRRTIERHMAAMKTAA